jgi:hypothetical protein
MMWLTWAAKKQRDKIRELEKKIKDQWEQNFTQ